MLLRLTDRFLPDAESGSQRRKVGIGASAAVAVSTGATRGPRLFTPPNVSAIEAAEICRHLRDVDDELAVCSAREAAATEAHTKARRAPPDPVTDVADPGWPATLGREISGMVRTYVARQVDPLVRRIDELEERLAAVQSERTRYRGTFSRVETYVRNDITTRHGQLWCCIGPVTGGMGPGQDPANWCLMTKSPHADKIDSFERRLNALEGGSVTPLRRAR